MEGIDFTAAINNLLAQGPIVTLALVGLYYTRRDLAEQKADNKELLGKVLSMHAETLTVIRDNATANVKLAESINDIEGT